MDDYTTKNIPLSSERLFFKINNKQVVFKTDKRTVEKLNDEDVLMNYVKAIINSRMLVSNGQNLINYPVNISRTNNLDVSSSYIELEISTTMQNDGVEELRCVLLNDGISNEIIKPSADLKSIIVNSSPIETNSWSNLNESYVPESIPALKWSTEMTSLLIALRGSLNDEFNSSKYKFKLWELIARRMNSGMLPIKVTAKDCDDKWRNIAATYRKNIEKIKYMGDFNVRWEHFAAMDEILKGTDELKKPDSFIEVDKMIGNACKFKIQNTNTENSSEIINMDSNDDDMDYLLLNSTTNANNEIRLWTQEMILLLFLLRRSMADRFDHATKETEKDLLWFDLVTKMNKSLGTNADIESYEAESLWNLCVEQYEENLDKLKAEGPLDVKWPYFAIMDQMLGGTIEIPDVCHPRPGEELVPAFMQGVWKQSEVREILNSYNKLEVNEEMDKASVTSDDSVVETKAGLKWHPELIRKLIHLRTDAEIEVKKWIRKPSSIWTVVLKKFRRLGIVLLTEQDLENKWNSLVRSYNRRAAGISKKSKSSNWPYFYGIQNAMTVIGNQNVRCVTPTQDAYQSDQPPEWFLSYMKRKEATDEYKYEELRNMIVDLQHSQIENRRLILSIFKKLKIFRKF